MDQKERKQTLEWFVQFAQSNLETLTPGDKAKLSVEAEEFLFPQKDLQAIGIGCDGSLKGIGGEPTVSKVEIQDIEGNRVSLPRWVPDVPSRESKEYWGYIANMQLVVRKTLSDLVFWLDLAKKHLGDKKKPPGVGHGRIYLWKEETYTTLRCDGKKYFLEKVVLPADHGRFIEIKIRNLFESPSPLTIQRCPGCSKIFVNTALRKKIFCSSRCMWKVNAAKWREENREEYNQRQKELMRGKYSAEKAPREPRKQNF